MNIDLDRIVHSYPFCQNHAFRIKTLDLSQLVKTLDLSQLGNLLIIKLSVQWLHMILSYV